MRASSQRSRNMTGVAASEEVLHVGDDPITDVVGARRAGMRNRMAKSRSRLASGPRAALAHISTLAEIL